MQSGTPTSHTSYPIAIQLLLNESQEAATGAQGLTPDQYMEDLDGVPDFLFLLGQATAYLGHLGKALRQITPLFLSL